MKLDKYIGIKKHADKAQQVQLKIELFKIEFSTETKRKILRV